MGNIWNDFGLNSIKRCNSKSNKPQNIVPPITPENFEIPKGYPAIMWNHIDNRVLISSWNILHLETVTINLPICGIPTTLDHFYISVLLLRTWLMQKCKLQLDQFNKRINSNSSNLTPPSLTACSSSPPCPGPEQKNHQKRANFIKTLIFPQFFGYNFQKIWASSHTPGAVLTYNAHHLISNVRSNLSGQLHRIQSM